MNLKTLATVQAYRAAYRHAEIAVLTANPEMDLGEITDPLLDLACDRYEVGAIRDAALSGAEDALIGHDPLSDEQIMIHFD